LRHRTLGLIRLPAAAILATTTAACTGSNPVHPAPSPLSSHRSAVSPQPSTSPLTSASPSATDMRAARAAILKLADVGSTYKETPYQPTAQSAQDDAALNSCIGRPPSPVHQTAKVFSMQFSRGDTLTILASITFVDTLETANADIVALRGLRAEKCIKLSLLEQYRRTGGQAAVSINPLVPSPAGNEPSANYRIKVLAQTANGTIPEFLDLVQVIKDRAEVSATFQDVNQPVSASIERRAMSAMLGRL